MFYSIIAIAPLLATTAMGQIVSFFTDTACQELNPDNYWSANCGFACTNLSGDYSVKASALEPNQQVVLYTGPDCKGDAYAAIGQAYASSVGENECAVSECDGFGSFMIQIYDSEGGGEACPPGTLTAAPTVYPKPTDGAC